MCLCSSGFGNVGQPVGPSGETDIVRRIVVDKHFGTRVHDLHAKSADYMDVYLCPIDAWAWRLCVSKGHTLPLKSHGMSFSSCVVEKEDV